MIEDWVRPILSQSAQADMLEHALRLFGRPFTDMSELTAYLDGLPTADDLGAAIADESRLLFDTEWSGPLAKQLDRHRSETLDRMTIPLDMEHAGHQVGFSLLGRMVQINDAVFESSQYEGSPLIDAPTSWQYLLWKYEYDQARSSRLYPDLEDVVLSKALQAAGSDELGIISGLPAEA